MTQQEISKGRILSSWKEIASYLGVSIKTVKRWKRKHNFPIEKFPSGRIMAYEREIINWQRNKVA